MVEKFRNREQNRIRRQERRHRSQGALSVNLVLHKQDAESVKRVCELLGESPERFLAHAIDDAIKWFVMDEGGGPNMVNIFERQTEEREPVRRLETGFMPDNIVSIEHPRK